MAQILLEAVAAEDEKTLCEGGFDYLTDLLYLVCLEDDFPQAALPCPLEFEVYNSQNHDRLARIVDATYQETLDCPKLNHVRQLDDVLAGYRATGEFLPGRWLIVRYENRDVGCLLAGRSSQIREHGIGVYGSNSRKSGATLGGGHCAACSMGRPASGQATVGVGGRRIQSSGDRNVRISGISHLGPAADLLSNFFTIMCEFFRALPDSALPTADSLQAASL